MPRQAPKFKDLELVKYDSDRKRQAILLIGSALEKGYERAVVKVSRMGFLAPADVVELAMSGENKKSRTKRGSASAPVAEFE